MGELSDGAILAAIGLCGGLALGLAARIGRFCTLGAIEDALYGGDTNRLRMWAAALGASVILAHLAAAGGVADFETSIYNALAWNPVASVTGGLLFGYGMALAGNCGYGALARLGGGDLRSLVIVIVAGLAAAATLGGPLASTRATLFASDPAGDPNMRGMAADLSQIIGAPPLVFAIAIGGALLALAFSSAQFRQDRRSAIWAFVVAAAVVSGWIGTSWMAATSFEDVRAGSHTFTAPLAETLFYLMTSSAGGLSFAVGSVTGVLAGACLGSIQKGHFRWEACDDPRELGRQILGAACMGVGGVVALGCSIGQGLTAFSALAWSAPVTLACIFVGAAIGLRQLIQGLPGFVPGGAP
ncbi:MAG: YeeE/YedE family protein [Pseudomonadota bacterium]